MKYAFPPLPLAEWQPTRDTLQAYARILGQVRRATTPRQKHWWHASLRVAATGLTTTSFPVVFGASEVQLDLTAHQVVAKTSRGDVWRQPLVGQSPARFAADLLAVLAGWGSQPAIDVAQLSDAGPTSYDRAAVEHFWQALAQIDLLFKQFQGELRQESSPVQLWPHHFDLAVLWITGNLIPGQDPANEEWSDEQMNFGFSTGDAGIPQPYFYCTAYPLPAGLVSTPLPGDAYWHTQSFTGAILPYASLVEAVDPAGRLLGFLRTVQQAGARLMLAGQGG